METEYNEMPNPVMEDFNSCHGDAPLNASTQEDEDKALAEMEPDLAYLSSDF